jgi:hypothetical protein
MASVKPSRIGSRIHRFTVSEYLGMIRSGSIRPDLRLELLGGLLVEPMTKFPPHDFTVHRLARILGTLLPEPWFAREEKSLVLGRYWRPEPDVVVLRGPDDRFRMTEPTASDVALLVEVADSSLTTDRGIKARRYAAVKIPCYWVVNLVDRRVEVLTNPQGRGRAASYSRIETYSDTTLVPVVIDGVEVGTIAVNDILP